MQIFLYNFVMNHAKQKIELLAPARDKNCAIAAINAGADAVYLGAADSGARKKAGNSLEDIKEITHYAHKFNVKVYVTVNTIIFDNELESVEKLIHNLYEIGVDALIIQDMAILKMNLPPIPLHASTQCNNDSIEKIKFLEKCNIERVVLPREFSLKEIEEVKNSTNVELEVFIHGALCVCYSGQCYLSASVGGRSANRGECAQPCRKKFSVVAKDGKILAKPQYLLSMKDFSMAKHLKRLIEIGVDSLKIEGRLKDENYVKNVVSYYRNLIDSINPALRPSFGVIKTDFIPDINKTFNRGYTDFNASGKCKNLINPKTPKFTGEKIGKITEIKGTTIKINGKNNLRAQDGIVFFDKNGDLKGTNVIKASGSSIVVRDSAGMFCGAEVFRNFDSEFDKNLNQAKFERKLPLEIDIKVTGEGFCVDLNKEFLFEVKKAFEPAKNPSKAIENVIAQFSKLGDSEFFAKKVRVDEKFSYFLPVSELNAIRREFVSAYQQFRKNNYKQNQRITEFEAPQYPLRELDYTFNVSNEKAKEFYEECGANVLECAFETGTKGKTLMVSKNCIRRELGLCLKNGAKPQDLYLVDEYGKKYGLEFDCSDCKMRVLND